MIRTIIPFSTLMAFTCAMPAFAQQATEYVPVTYHCERGVELQTVYVNPGDGEGAVIVQIDGRMLVLPQAISASGARYRGQEPTPYEFWSKGDTAFVAYGPEDNPNTILNNCVASSENAN